MHGQREEFRTARLVGDLEGQRAVLPRRMTSAEHASVFKAEPARKGPPRPLPHRAPVDFPALPEHSPRHVEHGGWHGVFGMPRGKLPDLLQQGGDKSG